MGFRSAESVSTAPVVATGLIGGYLAARKTGIRPLGGVLLGAAGASWLLADRPDRSRQ